jgi:hypothetical protein
MPRLLIVHHTPSPHCQEMLEAADGYLLGPRPNLGYLSGALKHYLVDYPAIR